MSTNPSTNAVLSGVGVEAKIEVVSIQELRVGNKTLIKTSCSIVRTRLLAKTKLKNESDN